MTRSEQSRWVCIDYGASIAQQERRRMKSMVLKRSVIINGRKTSVTLENAFWLGLKEIAQEKSKAASEMLRSMDAQRSITNLSSAIRLYILARYSERAVDVREWCPPAL
jgi:predicted DNA-binding ribbon-helix-helix protein